MSRNNNIDLLPQEKITPMLRRPQVHSILKQPKQFVPVAITGDSGWQPENPIPSILRRPGYHAPQAPDPKPIGNKISPVKRENKGWISNLIGRRYTEAGTIIRKQQRPFRINQIDNVLLDESNLQKGEILLSLKTTENFIPTGFNQEERRSDIIKVSSWIGIHGEESIVSSVKVSPY